MFINATGFYVPEERVDNQHFLELNGLTSEWIEQRTGIHTRSKAKEEENINTMSLEAVKDALPQGVDVPAQMPRALHKAVLKAVDLGEPQAARLVKLAHDGATA